MQRRRRPTLRILLDRKEIRRFKPATESVIKELDGATSDLETARQSLKIGHYKWATIQSFHSMSHAARALLYRTGYREENSQALIAGLHQLYEREFVDKMLDDLSDTLTLTEQLHDGRSISETAASKVLEEATDFLEQTVRILAAPREWFEKHPRPRRKIRKR